MTERRFQPDQNMQNFTLISNLMSDIDKIAYLLTLLGQNTFWHVTHVRPYFSKTDMSASWHESKTSRSHARQHTLTARIVSAQIAKEQAWQAVNLTGINTAPS